MNDSDSIFLQYHKVTVYNHYMPQFDHFQIQISHLQRNNHKLGYQRKENSKKFPIFFGISENFVFKKLWLFTTTKGT